MGIAASLENWFKSKVPLLGIAVLSRKEFYSNLPTDIQLSICRIFGILERNYAKIVRILSTHLQDNSLKMEQSGAKFGGEGSHQKDLKMSWFHRWLKFPLCILMGEAP